MALNVLVVLLALAAFLTRPAVRVAILAWPRAQRVLASAAVGLILVGHFIGFDRELFPLIRWGMFTYAWTPTQIVFHEIESVHADGSRELLRFGHEVFVSLRDLPYYRVERMGEAAYQQMVAGHADGGDEGAAYRAMLTAMGREATRHHPDRPVLSVEVVRGVIDTTTKPTGVTRHRLIRVEIPTEPSSAVR